MGGEKMNNKFKEILPCAALPESFLQAFGFSFDDDISKFELILEADQLAKVRVTFNRAPEMVKGVEKTATLLKDYKLVEI